jgi:DNA polymerase elongation subunit (family B)
MKSFYTNVELVGSNILLKEFDETGAKRHRKFQWQPTVYLRDDVSGETEYKSLYGNAVKPIQPGTVRETRDFIKQYDGVSGMEVYGQLNYILQFLNEHYPWDLQPDFSKLSIWSIDIETRTPDTGFPSPKTVDGEIVLITLQNTVNEKTYTFGLNSYTGTDTLYASAKDEYHLLKSFLMFWQHIDVDVVTGWNIETFDIPYLINRVKRILGEEETKRFSPWGLTKVETIFIRGKEETKVDISGIAILDYLALYKKYTYVKQESYSLKFIAQEELGHTKVELPGETFNDNIDNHWNEFVHYNIIDTKLVTELESKLKLLELALTMAYQAKINFNDVFSPVKMWDALIHNSLLKDKIVLPQRAHVGSRTIEGAYVKEPRTGFYNWIISLDATSLYPSIMMSLNISPETFRGRYPVTMDQMLKDSSAFDEAKANDNVSVSPIGAMFSRESQGILPKLIVEMMAARKKAKSEMLRLENEYQQTHDESLTPRIAALNAKQMAAKIALNSLYGALANEGCRFFNPDVAESITITGQFILKRIEERLNDALNTKFKTNNHPYLVYVDTDSVYVNVEPIVNKFLSGKEASVIVKSLEKVAIDILQEEINKICKSVAEELNFFENKIHFKLEAVGDKAIWIAKKKYVVRVHSSEGVTYATPKMKVMGLEMVRSSTPAFIRGKLKESLYKIFDGTQSDVQKFIEETRTEFDKLPITQIAFPRSANSLSEYSDAATIYKKATPIQVRGVLLYNNFINKMTLGNRYPLIQEGDKIKFFYLRMPNKFKENIMAIPADGVLPPEFGIDDVVDYNLQFEKSFLSAMEIVLTPIGWSVEEKTSLEDFFG